MFLICCSDGSSHGLSVHAFFVCQYSVGLISCCALHNNTLSEIMNDMNELSISLSLSVKRGFLKGKKSITLPKGGMVELLVKEAKNLTAVKSGSSDPFVKG